MRLKAERSQHNPQRRISVKIQYGVGGVPANCGRNHLPEPAQCPEDIMARHRSGGSRDYLEK